MRDQTSPSPTTARTPPRKGATHARMRARKTPRRGRSPEATTARNRKALAALDRWQAQNAVTAADPLDTLAAYADWIRAEIRLVRKLWGAETPGYVAQLADKMRGWALQIDQQIRDRLEQP